MNSGKMQKNKEDFMEYLGTVAKIKKAHNKLTWKEQNDLTKNYLKGEFDNVEVGFVDGLFELYKLESWS